MKKFYTVLLSFVSSLTLLAQGPNNTGTYYIGANGEKGSALKTALYKIISNHKTLNYDSLEDYYEKTDKRADGKVWDMYSCITNYSFSDYKGNYKNEGDIWNKEHSVPQSWFGKKSPMKSDIVHVVPTDGKINNMRGNDPFGEVESIKKSSKYDFSKYGPCKTPGYTGNVFEPNDEYKGDFARIYFYMATCYENVIKNWTASGGSSVMAGNSYPAYKEWYLNMLLRWAKEDPVSQKEIDRNNGVYECQKNRNPFVDYPGLEQYVWGELKNTPFSYDNYVIPDNPQPELAFSVSTSNINFGMVEINETQTITFTVTPLEMTSDIEISTTIGSVDVTSISKESDGKVEITFEYTPKLTGKQSGEIIISNGKQTSKINVVCQVGGAGEDVNYDFAKVTAEPEDGDWSGEYLIVYEEDKMVFNSSLASLDVASNGVKVDIKDNTISSTDDADMNQYVFAISKTEDGYLIRSTSELYIGSLSNKNGLNTDVAPTLKNKIYYNSKSVDIVSSSAYLRYNASSGQDRFRYYKTGSYSAQKPITLYKAIAKKNPTSVNSFVEYPSKNDVIKGVYDLTGRRVRNSAQGIDIKSLTPGTYIINGKKYFVK